MRCLHTKPNLCELMLAYVTLQTVHFLRHDAPFSMIEIIYIQNTPVGIDMRKDSMIHRNKYVLPFHMQQLYPMFLRTIEPVIRQA